MFRVDFLLCCRLRSRKLNQRNPQTLHMLLHMVVSLGPVVTVTTMVDLTITISALAVVVLALPLIGLMEALGVVGLVIMDMVLANLGVAMVTLLEVILVVVTVESPHLATPVALALMVVDLVGDMVAVVLVHMAVVVVVMEG